MSTWDEAVFGDFSYAQRHSIAMAQPPFPAYVECTLLRMYEDMLARREANKAPTMLHCQKCGMELGKVYRSSQCLRCQNLLAERVLRRSRALMARGCRGFVGDQPSP